MRRAGGRGSNFGNVGAAGGAERVNEDGAGPRAGRGGGTERELTPWIVTCLMCMVGVFVAKGVALSRAAEGGWFGGCGVGAMQMDLMQHLAGLGCTHTAWQGGGW